ncbi:MAG: CPP1-like family protein [Chroococcidiopsidaceae cyanobacterium CP_BM_RX_35]|nr:CPP1-like family protein [Chroococcidiopsidaceae cyanobacterium CP_BM_RX_35]
MIDQTPYEKLGVAEDATFDEIQQARTRLLLEYGEDAKRKEAIEAAYDAILMERLRMRQEGKIKVPEGIRFAERLSKAPAKESSAPVKKTPAWLQKLLDRPSLSDVLLPGIFFFGLSGLLGFYREAADREVLQLALILGVALSVYFLNRKERKFGRALLLTGSGLILGLIVGGLLGSWLLPQIGTISLSTEQFSTILTFFLLWLISSFLH